MNTRHLTIVHHSFDPNVIAASIVAGYFAFWQCQYLRKGIEVCSKAVVDYLSGKKSGE